MNLILTLICSLMQYIVLSSIVIVVSMTTGGLVLDIFQYLSTLCYANRALGSENFRNVQVSAFYIKICFSIGHGIVCHSL